MKKTTSVFMALILFATIPLFSQTWSALKRLTWNSSYSQNPAIATDSTGNGVHVVWDDETPGYKQIFFKRSTDSGTAWSAPNQLTWSPQTSINPSIALDPGNGIHVVWMDAKSGNYEIYYKTSTDGGATWSALKRITWNAGSSWNPAIAANPSNGIHVVWQDSTMGNREIFYKRSTDSGATWPLNKRLTWNSGWSEFPSISVDSSNGVHVVWVDWTPGNGEIFYKRSTDGGATWSAPTRLTWTTTWSDRPSIASDSGNRIHVVWSDPKPGNNEIFYKSSTDSGITWSLLKRITWNSGMSWNPSIGADSGNGVHVVWEDNTPGGTEIFYRGSTDSGVTWLVLKRISWNIGGSWNPSIDSDSGNGIHVVWYDNTPLNDEIFYKNRK